MAILGIGRYVVRGIAGTISYTALISTSNQLRGVVPSAITVKQTPSQAIEAPMSMRLVS